MRDFLQYNTREAAVVVLKAHKEKVSSLQEVIWNIITVLNTKWTIQGTVLVKQLIINETFHNEIFHFLGIIIKGSIRSYMYNPIGPLTLTQESILCQMSASSLEGGVLEEVGLLGLCIVWWHKHLQVSSLNASSVWLWSQQNSFIQSSLWGAAFLPSRAATNDYFQYQLICCL